MDLWKRFKRLFRFYSAVHELKPQQMLPRTKLVWWRWWLQLPVRDSSGSILCSAAWKFPRIDSALCAELLAICIGDEMALFQDLHGVTLRLTRQCRLVKFLKAKF